MKKSITSFSESHYGWVIVAAGAILMGFGFGGLASISIFMKPLAAEFGWSRAEISFAYTTGAGMAALGGLFFGQIVDRFPPRPVAVLGATLMAVSFLSLYWLQESWQLYAASALFGAGGVGACAITSNTTITTWFTRRRGLAVGLAGAGAAAGQGLVPYTSQLLISAFGWREAYLYLGLTYLVICLGAALLFRASPLSRQALDDLDNQAGHLRPLKPREVMTWFAIIPIFCCICMSIPIMHIAALVSDRGFSAGQAAGVMAVMMLSGALGRVIAGKLTDYFGGLNTFLINGAAQTLTAYWFFHIESLSGFYLLAIAFGLGYAGVMTCLITATREMIPARLAGTGLSITSLAGWTGMGIGALIGGVLYDLQGDYQVSYAVASLSGGVNLMILLAMTLRRRHKLKAMLATA